MNRKLGLAPMSFTTKAGVRYGKQRMLGTELEWTEEPWEWRQHAWLINERVYRNGLFKSIQGRFEVTPLGTQSRVSLSFTPIYRFPLLAPLLAWATKRLLRQLMDVIESTIREQQNQPPKVLPELDLAAGSKRPTSSSVPRLPQKKSRAARSVTGSRSSKRRWAARN